MQNFQGMQELSDQDLENATGGSHNHFSSTGASVNVGAYANGGILHIDQVLASTQSISIHTSSGEGVSAAIGFAIGIAI